MFIYKFSKPQYTCISSLNLKFACNSLLTLFHVPVIVITCITQTTVIDSVWSRMSASYFVERGNRSLLNHSKFSNLLLCSLQNNSMSTGFFAIIVISPLHLNLLLLSVSNFNFWGNFWFCCFHLLQWGSKVATCHIEDCERLNMYW